MTPPALTDPHGAHVGLNGKPLPASLTLAQLAEAKRLPVEFLRGLGVSEKAVGASLVGGTRVNIARVEIDYRDAAGNLLYQKSRLKLNDGDAPKSVPRFRVPKGAKQTTYGDWRLDLAQRLAQLFLVEGESDCWAMWLHDRPALGAPGADAAKSLTAEHLVGIETLYIHQEPDAGGERFVFGIVERLKALGYSAKVLVFNCGAKDPSDLHALSPEEFDARLDAALANATPIDLTDDDRPATGKPGKSAAGPPPGAILIDTDEFRVIDEVTGKLAESDADLYQRGGQLVRVSWPARPPGGKSRLLASGGPRIEPLPSPDLRTRITRHCQIVVGKSYRPASPPEWLVKGIAAQAAPWQGIRPLESVTETPLLRSDGTILQAAGYDSATGILYQPALRFESIPAAPTRADALAARDQLLEVVCDFPFAAPMHRAAWLASLLTPLARPAFDGPAPLFLTDANIRGCGKGLSASCAALIATGRPFATAIYSHDPIEMRKVITAIALAGEPLIMLDNVTGAFGNASLDAALTSTEWNDRVLGRSEQPRVPLTCCWYATGNNCLIAADTARRVCHVRIESPEERPEEREGFRHPDLLAWVKAERPRLLRAALTVLAAYCAAGRPQAALKPWGSFDGWSALIRQCVVWLDLPDVAETRVALAEESDTDMATLRTLMAAWSAVVAPGGSARAAEFVKRVGADSDDLRPHQDALLALMPSREGGLPSARQVGNTLKRFKNRVCDGLYFAESKDRDKYACWRLVGRGAESAESCGVSSNDTRGRTRTGAGAHAHANRPKHTPQDSADSAAEFDLADPAEAEREGQGDAWEAGAVDHPDEESSNVDAGFAGPYRIGL